MTQKEKILGFMKENMQFPMTAEEIAMMLCVPKEAMQDFLLELEGLEQDGSVVKTKKKRYAIPSVVGCVSGKFIANERGFGFVVPQEGEDVFIGAEQTAGALNGDIVVAKILEKQTKDKRSEGEIIKILQSAEHKIVGRYMTNRTGGFVSPINRRYSTDFYVEKGKELYAKDGDMVVLKLTKRAAKGKCPQGEILSVIGNRNTPGIDILSVVESRNIPYKFPEEVLEIANQIPQIVQEQDIDGRKDYRNELIITIDGDDAKDLDDAVHVKRMENGNFELGVHIADVGHFVQYLGAIDREAYARGTSIYLADRVIPMLPEALSNGVCSLNAGEDKLTMSVVMEIDKNGSVVNYHIAESVICSKNRMTYANVTAILEGNRDKQKEFAHLVPMLTEMEQLQKILRKKRVQRGSIDFNFEEARIVLDQDGKPVDIVKRERGIANNVIEEFMLVCNETVAEHMFWLGTPFIYRVHEEPDPDTIKEFVKFIKPFGYTIKHSGGVVHPRELAMLIRNISGKREEMIISSVALRSLMKARYSDENLGHFGLSSKYYCHFTSPIRRYPDLAIHRIIKDSIKGKIDEKKLQTFVQDAAKQSSERELEAVDVERAVEDMKKAEFMSSHVGDVYDGVISSITQFGMFVTLENTIEGLVRLADMREDYYIYNDTDKTVTGERSNKTYQIGDSVAILVAKADAESGKIEFVLQNEKTVKPYMKKRRKKR